MLCEQRLPSPFLSSGVPGCAEIDLFASKARKSKCRLQSQVLSTPSSLTLLPSPSFYFSVGFIISVIPTLSASILLFFFF